jgi:hypothetical protein
LGLLVGSSRGQGPRDRESRDAAIQARLEQRKAFGERMRNAGSMEERIKMMEEMRAMDRQRTLDGFKSQLGVTDPEWAILKPRLETVYNMANPQPARIGGIDRKRTEVEQTSGDLRDILDKPGVDTNQIKTRLIALRAARGRANEELAKARQSLRQLLTVRQEAELVLSGLLD